MANYYSDGKSAKFIEIPIQFGADAIDIKIEGQVLHWKFDDLRLVDKYHRRISNVNDEDARISLDVDTWDKLSKLSPGLKSWYFSKSHLKLIGGLVALSVGLLLFVTYGIRIISYPLAKYTPKSYEEQLSKNIKAQLDVALDFCPSNDAGQKALQRVANQITQNSHSNFKINVAGIKTPMVNAFAMPAGQVYVTNGLINSADDGEELAAVLAHEIAHVENRDVLVSLYQAMGAGLVFDAVVGGGSGAGQQVVMLGANLSNLKNSRALEVHADSRGLELLEKANIDGRGMSRFFEKLNKEEADAKVFAFGKDKEGKSNKIDEIGEFLSSHPNSEKRAIIAAKTAKAGSPAFTAQEWQSIKNYCK